MQARIEVEAGICGFRTTVLASSPDDQNVVFQIASGCEKILGVARDLQAHGPVDAYAEFNPAGQSVVMATVRDCLKGCCAGCAVPVGLFKGMQVAAGLALPKDICLKITQE
jgi:hypothetical protein